MKKVLVINPEVSSDIRGRLAGKLGDDYSITYVEDLLMGGADEKTVKNEIKDSDSLILVIIPDVDNNPLDWVLAEAHRLGKRIVVIYLDEVERPVPGGVGAYADATVNIESPSFGAAIGGGSVFETPDMQTRASRTMSRGEC